MSTSHTTVAFAAVTISLLVIAGCGTGLPGEGQPASARDMITEEIREACSYFDDDFIAFLINLSMSDKEQGFSEYEELQAAVNGCVTGCEGECLRYEDCDPTIEALCEMECASCASAVIDLVYR